MEKRNKLVDGMLIGALVGAAVSLFDKDTRTAVIHNGKQIGGKIKYAVQHPKDVAESVCRQVQSVKNTVDDVAKDLEYLRSKVNELKETTPQVVEIVNETKEVIAKHLDNGSSKK